MDEAVLTNATGLENSALASAFVTSEARLSRAVKDRSIKFEPRDVILSSLGPACNGTGVGAAGRYAPNGEFHAVVALTGDGKSTSDVTSLQNAVRDARWEPSGVRFGDLVACVGGESTTSVEVCPYIGERTGARTFITRYQLSRQVRLVAAATGAVVSQRTFSGGFPTACPDSTFTSQTEIRGTRPSFDDVKAWLGDFVKL